MIQHIIFDLDGTLLDTLTDLTRAISDTLVAYQLPPVTQDIVRGYLGGGAKAFVKMALKQKGDDPAFFDAFFADYLVRYKDYQLQKSKPYPGIIALLDALKRANIPLYVFSNKPHEFCIELIEARLPGYFKGVHGHILHTAPKPNPEMFLRFAKTHKIHPREALYIGDSHFDYEFGQNLRMKTILVGYGYEDESALLALKPDGYVQSSTDLQTYIFKMLGD